jgi:stage II sporulation protein D
MAAPPPEVRVLIESGSEITVDGGAERIGILPQGERPDGEIVVGEQAIVTAGAEGLFVDGIPAGRVIVLSNISKYYTIGRRQFRGKIEMKWKAPGQVIVVNHVPLEEYLAGLLGSEMYPHWPIEALKAQAVAARTYALHHSNASRNYAAMKDYDVDSSVLSQVYEGAHKEGARAREACRQTKGMALLRNGSIFSTYYHSCCGGMTEHAGNVWPGENGPPQIKDTFCSASPKRAWTYAIYSRQLAAQLATLGIPIGTIAAVGVEKEEDSPRNKYLVVRNEAGEHRILATDLRKTIGYSHMKSTWFDVSKTGGAIVFKGRGYGHGVGMCQWGAKGMADQGYTYEQILKHYYPDAELSRVY